MLRDCGPLSHLEPSRTSVPLFACTAAAQKSANMASQHQSKPPSLVMLMQYLQPKQPSNTNTPQTAQLVIGSSATALPVSGSGTDSYCSCGHQLAACDNVELAAPDKACGLLSQLER